MESLLIHSSQGKYPVDFDPSLAALVQALMAVPKAVVFIDRTVAGHYRAALAPLLERCPVYEIECSEEEKTLEGCARALTFLQANNASRQTQVIALGGGVLQDIATFCTHVYYRGLKWVYVPTTLLGMADSCIGAKASINFNGFKNQLGVFHSPSAVRICLEFLGTLPDVEIRSGYGEIVKLHLVGSRAQFADLARTLTASGWRNPRLAEFVRASLAVKQAIIEVDEFDDGIRRTLNYGHTFGHALEAITHHGIPHGLAVAWGMDLINYLACRKGLLSQADFEEIHALLQARFAWKLPQPIDRPALVAATRRDKKSKDGKMTLVLPRAPGALEIFSQEYNAELEAWIDAYLANLSIVTS